jgi:hypothetical protein
MQQKKICLTIQNYVKKFCISRSYLFKNRYWYRYHCPMPDVYRYYLQVVSVYVGKLRKIRYVTWSLSCLHQCVERAVQAPHHHTEGHVQGGGQRYVGVCLHWRGKMPGYFLRYLHVKRLIRLESHCFFLSFSFS